MVRRDTANRYVLLLDERSLSAPNLSPLPDGVEVKTVAVSAAPAQAAAASGARSMRDILRMSAAVPRLKSDVFFFPASYSYFPVLGPPVVVTVHDAIAERLPHLTLPSRADRLRWRLKQKAAMRQAAAVMTVSRASRRAIEETLGVASDRLHVVREAADPMFRSLRPPERAARLRRFGAAARSPYLLYVGGISPHKNLEVLIEAFERVAPDHPDLHLLLAGDTDDDPFLSSIDSVRAALSASPVRDRIRLLGFVSDDELVALYGAAVATALPSLGEGFGLTAAESAACGTPVVTSEDPALVELLGDAALTAPATSVDGFARHFSRLVSDAGHRAAVAEAVRRKAAEWSWASTADQTIGVLEKVVSSRG
ncbi:MAG: glycosyltransferase family 4 protein [Actinomycetota bacterium]|nr:glycosyltransferase family 4 protein [Actinomycetota bacterium]